MEPMTKVRVSTKIGERFAGARDEAADDDEMAGDGIVGEGKEQAE
jgi:hypothetical protein